LSVFGQKNGRENAFEEASPSAAMAVEAAENQRAKLTDFEFLPDPLCKRLC